MWTNINQTYATPQSKNAWAHLPTPGAWRRVKPTSSDGVTNTFLLLALAKAHNKKAHVIEDSSHLITSVYF